MIDRIHHERFLRSLCKVGLREDEVYLHANGYVDFIYEVFSNPIYRNLKILDYGSGTGFLCDLLCHYGADCYRYDVVCDETIDAFKRNNKQSQLWELLRGKTWDLKEDGFDLIICHASFEHFDDVYKEVACFKRTLIPKGYVMIMRCPQPMSYSEKITRTHKNLYSIDDLVRFMEGFDLIKWCYSDFMVWSFPWQGFYNNLYPITLSINKVALRTPLRRFSHNINAVFQLKKVK